MMTTLVSCAVGVALGLGCSSGGSSSSTPSSATPSEAPSGGKKSAPTGASSSAHSAAGTSGAPGSSSEVGPNVEGAPARTDYLSFAQGALPVKVSGTSKKLGANFENAISSIDGNDGPFVVAGPLPEDGALEFVYALPASTTFDMLAVPNVSETPSPSQTFIRTVEVHGSSKGPDGPYELLGSATLATHPKRGQVTQLRIEKKVPVRWVHLRLQGGIKMEKDESWFQFSEIIGHGSQEPMELAKHFNDVWKGKGVLLETHQEGATVTGCYDDDGELQGTVSGNILHATGVTPAGIQSLFVLGVVDGTLRGLRSTNGAPFTLYTAPSTPGTKTKCSSQPPPKLGCGSIVHGIHFDFDSAKIRADSETVLADLHGGLASESKASVLVEGHTSSEGADEYNLDLSKRRAQAVVDDLVKRGLDRNSIRAVGKGEAEPIAKNTDEAGRALNRRVAIVCK